MTEQERITELERRVESLERQLAELQSELTKENSKTIRFIRKAIAEREALDNLARYGRP